MKILAKVLGLSAMSTLSKQPVLLVGLVLAALSLFAGWELQQTHSPVQLESELSLAVSGGFMWLTTIFLTIVSMGLATRDQ